MTPALPPSTSGLTTPSVSCWPPLALDATDQGVDASSIAMGLCARLGVSPDGDAAISDLVSKPELLRAAAARPTQLGQNHVLQLASHLGSEASARASYVQGVVLGPMEQWEREALDELLDRLLPWCRATWWNSAARWPGVSVRRVTRRGGSITPLVRTSWRLMRLRWRARHNLSIYCHNAERYD